MSKIKVKPKSTIKKLNKNVVQLQKIKNNAIKTKNKINEYTMDEEYTTAEDYASNKVQEEINYISRNGISTIKEKQKNRIKNIAEKNNKRIKNRIEKSIKTAENTTKLAKKEIKTAEKVAKSTRQMARESAKLSQRTAKMVKKSVQTTARVVKVVVKVIVETVKTIIVATKALVSAIVAGGWIAVVIIIIIVAIAGLIAVIFNSNADEDFDSSQIPSSEIVLVAKAQIGNEGGDKFWKWYGFKEHVHWCACYVSWCANECNYIDRGIIPKFAVCNDGIKWFKEKNQWNERGESYYPIIGDIIFFDWYNDNGEQDGSSDHVGIVTRTDIENRIIYTIEGNTNNKCAERLYSFDDVQVMGYGSPRYE